MYLNILTLFLLHYLNISCKKGNCGTCELLMNGRIEKACVAKIPAGKVKIQSY